MTDTIEAGKVAASIIGMPSTLLSQAAYDKLTAGIETYAADRITAHTKALIEGAGMLHGRLTAWGDDPEELGHMKPEFAADLLDQAAATIAAMKAEIERLTERADQAKLDGVRVDKIASIRQGALITIATGGFKGDKCRQIAREALNAMRAAALSDLIAGDADLIDGGK